MQQIATVMRRRRLEWFGHVKRREDTENIPTVVEMNMEGSALEDDESCGVTIISEGTASLEHQGGMDH